MDKPNKWAGSTSWGKARSRGKDGELIITLLSVNSEQEIIYGELKNCGGFGQTNKRHA